MRRPERNEVEAAFGRIARLSGEFADAARHVARSSGEALARILAGIERTDLAEVRAQAAALAGTPFVAGLADSLASRLRDRWDALTEAIGELGPWAAVIGGLVFLVGGQLGSAAFGAALGSAAFGAAVAAALVLVGAILLAAGITGVIGLAIDRVRGSVAP